MGERIGLVGFGIMGTAMTTRFLEADASVVVFDVADEARGRARDMGCETTDSPAAVAKACEVILISLPRPEHVTSVVQGADGLLTTASAGHVIADTSTVDPQTTQANAAAAAEQGVGYIDSPVLGRPRAVGNWTMPVGGEAVHLERVEPVLRIVASRVIHLGPSGHGNTLKLLNNLMFGAINSAACESFALADRLGMDRALFFDTIVDSGAGTVSNLFRDVGPRIVDGDFEPQFSVDNLEKDIGLGLAMARSKGLTLEVAEAGQRLNQRAQAAGHGPDDTASVVEVIGLDETDAADR